MSALVRPEYHAFFESAFVPICGFTLFRRALPSYRGAYIDLTKFYGADQQSVKALEAIRNPDCGWFYRASTTDFKKIPGSPIAYWVTERMREVFSTGTPIGEVAAPRKGNTTTDNNRFLRFWPEVSWKNSAFGYSSAAVVKRDVRKWVPYNKGGGYRKWYGYNEFLVNWFNDGAEIKSIPHSVIANEKYFFNPGLTWSTVSSSSFSIRSFQAGFIFDNGGCCVFASPEILADLILFMNSCVFVKLYSEISPTLNFQSGDVARVPYIKPGKDTDLEQVIGVILSKRDWDSREQSWDFSRLPLLSDEHRCSTLKGTYHNLRSYWADLTSQLRSFEQSNNNEFIQLYGLGDELSPFVPLEEVSLLCNPHFRYGGDKSEQELEEWLRADTMKDFISYAVGCMFGRYALEKPGLILANQGDTTEQYLNQIPTPSFPADKDNVIPILDGDWFPDDISERFKKFLRVTFSDEHFEENLNFIQQSIGKGIRAYFAKDFYNDHVKRYKKRPIYWLFSSPKGSFNALIYMHRYRPDTVSVVLNDYLREFRTKLTSSLDHQKRVEASADTSKAEKTKALKEIESLKKTIDELATWERDVLYPLATQQIEIDLDDGVKVNYAKFGAALKKIPGLDVSEE